jgi:hypothetical protein
MSKNSNRKFLQTKIQINERCGHENLDKCGERCGHEVNKHAMIGRRNQHMVAAPDRPASYKRGGGGNGISMGQRYHFLLTSVNHIPP